MMRAPQDGRLLTFSFSKAAKGSLIVSIPKKYAKKAVERNKLKRWIRELWRGQLRDDGAKTEVRLIGPYKQCSYGALQREFVRAGLRRGKEQATLSR